MPPVLTPLLVLGGGGSQSWSGRDARDRSDSQSDPRRGPRLLLRPRSATGRKDLGPRGTLQDSARPPERRPRVNATGFPA